ncbi:MAG: methylenetetrahydrofolate reductase [Nanoarchaeota archaeon]
MHITEHLKNRNGRTKYSIEVIPPDKGKAEDILQTVEALLPYEPLFISVTAHPDLVQVVEKNGHSVVQTKRRGLNTHAICWTLKEKYAIEVIPHVIGMGFTKKETEDALHDLRAFGIENVLALRGDAFFPPGYTSRPTEYAYAVELVQQIAGMNNGTYIESYPDNEKANFCIGVAGYPEGHSPVSNLAKEAEYLKMKIDSGASFIICNMFFDNTHYFSYKERLHKEGITIPVIPALKVVSTLRQIEFIPERFNVTIPDALQEKIRRYTTPQDRKKAGIEHVLSQATGLIDTEEPCIHFYSMGRATPLADVFAMLNGRSAMKKYGLL